MFPHMMYVPAEQVSRIQTKTMAQKAVQLRGAVADGR